MRRTWHTLGDSLWAVARRGGQGRPVLLLHGFTGTGLDFASLLSAFGDRPLLAPDLPGHGRTSRSPSPPACDLSTVRRGLSALVNAGSASLAPDVVGYSMGGRIALDALVSQAIPVNRLVLIGATAGLADPNERAARRAADAAWASQVEALGTHRFLTLWQSQPMFARLRARCERTEWARIRRLRADADPRGLAAALRGLGTGDMPDLGPGLAALACPVLCLAGAEDEKFVVEGQALASRLASARFERVANAGHAAHLEQPAACTALVRAFLAADPQ